MGPGARADVQSDDVDGLLGQARACEERGDMLGAIDHFQAAVALRPDTELELHLVALRHAAYDRAREQHPRAQWPPTYDDPFPGHHPAAGPPEIAAGDLSAEMIGGSVQHHGCLIIRGLLDAATIESIATSIEQAFAARSRRRAGTPEPDDDAWFHPFEPGKGRGDTFGHKAHVRTVDSPRTLARLMSAYRATGVLDAITTYLGERPALSTTKFALRSASPGIFGKDFHQDGQFLGEEIRTANLWTTLSPCGVDAPGVDVIAQRVGRILPYGVDGAVFDWVISPTTVARELDDPPVVRPVFEAGDAMVFDQMLVHRTARNGQMTRDRLAVEAWFFAPSTYPDSHQPIVA